MLQPPFYTSDFTETMRLAHVVSSFRNSGKETKNVTFRQILEIFHLLVKNLNIKQLKTAQMQPFSS